MARGSRKTWAWETAQILGKINLSPTGWPKAGTEGATSPSSGREKAVSSLVLLAWLEREVPSGVLPKVGDSKGVCLVVFVLFLFRQLMS